MDIYGFPGSVDHSVHLAVAYDPVHFREKPGRKRPPCLQIGGLQIAQAVHAASDSTEILYVLTGPGQLSQTGGALPHPALHLPLRLPCENEGPSLVPPVKNQDVLPALHPFLNGFLAGYHPVGIGHGRSHRHKLKQHELVKGSGQIHPHLLPAFQGFLKIDPPRNQVTQQPLAFQHRVLRHLQAVLIHEPGILSLLLNHIRHLLHCFQKLGSRNRLQKIVRHPDVDGLLGIVKFIVPAKYNDFDSGKLLFHQFREFQSVHEGHADIRYEDVRLHLSDKRIGQFSVAGLPCEFQPFLLPWNVVLDAVPHDDLILHKKYLYHNPAPPSYVILSIPSNFCLSV